MLTVQIRIELYSSGVFTLKLGPRSILIQMTINERDDRRPLLH